MRETVILLTKTFPFASGEEFLEEEIKHLAKRFNKVYIVATAVPGHASMTRTVPNNVNVVALHEVQNRYLKYAKYVTKGIGSLFQSDTQEDFKGKNALGKLGVIYFAGRCRSISNKILSIPELKKTLQSPDTVLYSYWFADLPYVAVLVKRKVGNDSLKIVSRAHGYDLYDYRNASGYIPFRRLVMTEIDKVYPCSQDGQQYLQERYPESVDKIEVSYLGTLDCGSGNKERHEKYNIATCSAIIPLKRLSLLAEALKILEDSGDSCDWTCIGDGPLLMDLEAYVKENLKECSVTFTGRLKHERVLELLKDTPVDLFVNVSETEGLPVSIMEAISFGIPALATDVGGTKEIVIPHKTGMLLRKDTTPAEIAEKIKACKGKQFDHELIRAYWNENFNSNNNFSIFAEKLRQD